MFAFYNLPSFLCFVALSLVCRHPVNPPALVELIRCLSLRNLDLGVGLGESSWLNIFT